MPPSFTRSSECSRPWIRRVISAVVVAGLASGGIGAALITAEAALRFRHFQYQPFPEVQFGWPEPRLIATAFEQDPDLLWVPKDYRQRLQSARRTHPAVIFLGDSCVEFSTYPQQTIERLSTLVPSLASGEKLSVPGWSSEQGRAQLHRDVLPLEPKVVTIEFGWNDHWDALGPPDDRVHPGALEQWAGEHLRVYQAYVKARDGLDVKRHPERPRRVSLARYQDNLQRLAREATGGGARVVLITAPSGHVAGQEPLYLQARHLKQLSMLLPLHDAYVQATRAAATASGAWLCDAADAVGRMGTARASLFRHDGIHFSDEGDRFMGQLVAECIARASPS